MPAPVIGITSDIDFQLSEPPPSRAYYFLDTTLVAAISSAGGIPMILPHVIEHLDDYLDRVDGLVISGDSYRFTDPKLFPDLNAPRTEGDTPEYKLARTRFELKAAEIALQHDIPTLGICAGYQVMNVAAGGDVIVSLNDEFGPSIQHRQTESLDIATHEVKLLPNTQLRAIVGNDHVQINSLHSQGIRVAASLTASAVAPDGLVEAMEAPDKRFFVGVQWHPEFVAGEADQKILQSIVRVCKQSSSWSVSSDDIRCASAVAT